MTILLAGCGDLGTETGLRFAAAGHRVVGWRRSPDKLPAEIEGVATTRELFLEILDEPRFGSGRYTTAYLDDARGALPSLAEQVA